jgi:hypothetical protein
MKKFYAIVLLFVFKIGFLSAQPTTILDDGLVIVANGVATNYYVMVDIGVTGVPLFSNANLGSFIPSSGNTLELAYPFMNFILNPDCPVQDATFSYRVYEASATPPAGTPVVLTLEALGATIWSSPTTNINLLALAPAVGNHKIDIKYDYTLVPSVLCPLSPYSSGWISANFSRGAAVIVTPLAVEMSTFTARKKSNKEVAILWKTEQEKGHKNFIIERSSDGLSFSNIGNLKGAENSTVEKSYNFTDVAPLQGMNYYRLTSVDMQGKETMSKIIAVNFADKLKDKLQLYPNPANTALQVEVISEEEATKSVQVFDLAGRMILYKNAVLVKGLNTILLDVNVLSSGTYLVKMGSEMSRFVKM